MEGQITLVLVGLSGAATCLLLSDRGGGGEFFTKLLPAVELQKVAWARWKAIEL